MSWSAKFGQQLKKTNPGGDEKISLPFVCVRHLSHFCAFDRFDAYGQKLIFVLHHKPQLLPFFIDMFSNRQR
jgi:hypothetical protein